MAAAENQIALISMPFGPVFCPSLALGLLKAELQPLNLSTKIFHYTLRFAELIGAPLYFKIALGKPFSTEDLVGEWLFSQALFSPLPLDGEGYIDNVLRKSFRAQGKATQVTEALIRELQDASGKVEAFLEACAEELMAYHPTIVGFSSVYHQHIASLALAKRLKAARPEAFLVFGGANCQGIMGAELIRQFSFVDAAVSGDGDLVFPILVKRVLTGDTFEDLQGVYTRKNIGSAGRAFADAPRVDHMDSLPITMTSSNSRGQRKSTSRHFLVWYLRHREAAGGVRSNSAHFAASMVLRCATARSLHTAFWMNCCIW